MKKFLNYKIVFILLVLTMVILTNCSPTEPLKVAVMTKIDAGSLVGKSNLDIINHYVDKHDVTEIEFVFFDDGWDLEKIPEVYAEIRAQGIDIILTRHTSTGALELKKYTDKELDEVLVFITGSTTDQLTGFDDNNIRVIQDVAIEQTSIADQILGDEINNLLIIRDLDNHQYTEPALKYFTEHYDSNYEVLDISISSVNVVEIEKIMRKYDYDGVYTLIGGNAKIIGALAQMAWQVNHDVKIYFTPWSRATDVLSTAGPAIDQCIMASHFPSRNDSIIISEFLEAFNDQFGYIPEYNILTLYMAVDLLHKAVEEGNRTAKDVKNWIINEKVIDTPLGEVTLDEYGDTDFGLYFIEDIMKEYE